MKLLALQLAPLKNNTMPTGVKRSKRLIIAAAVHSCLCSLLPAAAPEAPAERYEFTQIEMGMPFKVILYASDAATANQAASAAFSRIHELNKIMSDYDPESELSQMSRSSPSAQGVKVSDPLWFVICRSQELAEKSAGAFDITVGPLVRLWRRARREKEMPSEERLAEARQAVGYQYLKLDRSKHTVQLLKPNMQLDLGGIAAGYAVDEALSVLRKRGIHRALVDASGDVGVSDPPPGKSGWRIGIAPLAADGPPSRYLLLARAAVTTSGDAYQYVELGGKRYSHIVDPRTGLGLTNSSTVVVVAPDCITADSYTKPLSVLDPKAGLELIDNTPASAAIIIRAAGGEPEVYESKRFKDLNFAME